VAGELGRSRNPLIAKLSRFVRLSDDDVRVLDGLCLKEERFGADVTLVAEGGPAALGLRAHQGRGLR